MAKKLVIIVSHPIQYFVPLYQALAKLGGVECVVVYFSDSGAKTYFDEDFGQNIRWDVDLLSGYKYYFLKPGIDISQLNFWRKDAAELENVLTAEDPDVILLNGYGSRLNWRAWLWAIRNKRYLIYFSDSNVLLEKCWFKRLLKKLIVGLYFFYFDIFLAVSDRNVEYLKLYGAKESKIRFSPFSIDVDRFLQGSKKVEKIKKRKKYAINYNSFVLVYLGKLVSRKRPQDLLNATINLRKEGRNIQALFVGDGHLMQRLKASIENSVDKNAAVFTGFKNQQQIPELLALADAFVFPSVIEPYGLAATEAAACGLPLIMSSTIGCIGPRSIAQEGKNALVYPSGDVDKMMSHIRLLMDNSELLKQMRNASLTIVAKHDISYGADTINKTVLELCGSGGRL